MTDELDPTLERAAEAVADQQDVEWTGAAGAGELATTLERLRQIDRLARAHRSARDAASDADPIAGAASRAASSGDAPGAGSPDRVPFVWGPLRVLEKLAEGSFGEVYRAFDPALAREVALKLRRSDAGQQAGTRRWLDEARHLARVRHPNVVTVHGAAEHAGRAGLWTELLQGETLEARLQRDGPLGAREALGLGIELCGALAAVHRAGVVHGDVTTSNVMRESGAGDARTPAPGRVVLMDFGAGRESGRRATSGTPLACAPEVLGGGPVTPASDVYSLGVLLFRILAGRYPFEAASIADLRAAIAGADRPGLRERRPDLPPDLVAAVERALEPDPSRRFASAGAMEAALSAAMGGAPAGTPAGSSERSDRLERRVASPLANRAGWTLAAAALGVALVIALGFWIRARGPAQRAPVEAAAPPPNAAGAPAPLAMDASLMRRGDQGSEPLADGAHIAVGDRLALDIRSPEKVWAYVFNRDASGRTYALFPLAGLETTNPLSPAELHRLPGRLRGRPFAWQVTSAGGDESFVIVASRHPLPDVESLLSSLEAASPDREPGADPRGEAAEATRGVGGLAPDPSPAGRAPARLPELLDALSRSGDPGVWLRTVRVSNPAR